MDMKNKFYVSRQTSKGKTVAFSVVDNVGGMVSEHERFDVSERVSESEAKVLAMNSCDEMNSRD